MSCSTDFIDYCISKRLLVPSGTLALLHLQRDHSDPRLPVLSIISIPLHLGPLGSLILQLITEHMTAANGPLKFNKKPIQGSLCIGLKENNLVGTV